jgi:hypothetical protein
MTQKYKHIKEAIEEVSKGNWIYSVAQNYCPENPADFISEMAKFARRENSQRERGLENFEAF